MESQDSLGLGGERGHVAGLDELQERPRSKSVQENQKLSPLTLLACSGLVYLEHLSQAVLRRASASSPTLEADACSQGAAATAKK